MAGNGNSHARETPVAQLAGRLLYYWLDVRAEQGIPGSIVFPSTRSTGKPWGYPNTCQPRMGLPSPALMAPRAAASGFGTRSPSGIYVAGMAPEEAARWLGVSDPAVMARYQRVMMAPAEVV